MRWSPEVIVSRWGWQFRAAGLPLHIERMEMGECFANAQRLVTLSANTSRPLIYCEGILAAGRADPTGDLLHHAWCVDGNGIVIDPTWPDDTARIYEGIAFRSWILPHYDRVHGTGFTLLNDPEMLDLTEQEWATVAYCRCTRTGGLLPMKPAYTNRLTRPHGVDDCLSLRDH